MNLFNDAVQCSSGKLAMIVILEADFEVDDENEEVSFEDGHEVFSVS